MKIYTIHIESVQLSSSSSSLRLAVTVRKLLLLLLLSLFIFAATVSQSSQGISWTWAGSVFHLPHFIHTHYSTMISHCIHVYHSRQPESLFMTLCNIWSLGLREAQFWGWLVMADLHEHPCCSNICKCLQKLLTCSRQRSWQHGPHRSLACLVVRDFNHKLPQYWWSNVHQVRFLQVLRSVNHVYWSENMQHARGVGYIEASIVFCTSCAQHGVQARIFWFQSQESRRTCF